MYIPAPFVEADPEAALVFLQAHPFALLVTAVAGTPMATHVPVAAATEAAGIVLRGHLARANPQAATLDGAEALVVFGGPHAYVSPRHYLRAESVPTWNYLAVHAHGRARTRDARQGQNATRELERSLAALVGQHEPAYQQRWDGMSEPFRRGMLDGIIGFELVVERLEGVAKLSQNKTVGEQRTIAAALAASDDAAARATGTEMQRRLDARAADPEGEEPASR